ncbi:MAG: DUF4864 domain-containing protein [Amaricoccus sp.]
MRRWLMAVVLAAALLPSAARSQDAAPEIRAAISDQIAAFQTEDIDRAFAHASPAVRHRFRSAERFCRMVRDGFPMIWHPARLQFASRTERDGRTFQNVLITDRSGTLYVAEFAMVRVDGDWRIDGVEVRLAEGTSA